MHAQTQLQLTRQLTKQAFWKDLAYVTPGYGTYLQGRDALKNFSQGNYWSGAGNLLGAGLTLLPGIGGLAGGATRFAGRLGMRALGRAGMPTFGRAVSGLGNAGGALGNASDRLLKWGLPKLGAPGRMMAARPGASGLALGGASMGAASVGDSHISNRVAQAVQGGHNPNQFMNFMRSQLPVNNPLRARAGGF